MVFYKHLHCIAIQGLIHLVSTHQGSVRKTETNFLSFLKQDNQPRELSEKVLRGLQKQKGSSEKVTLGSDCQPWG